MIIRSVILRNIEGNQNTFTDDDLLTEFGLDSLNFVKIIVELEEEFGVTINDDDLMIENFNTVNKIKTYLAEKCGVKC